MKTATALQQTATQHFYEDVVKGLTGTPKYLQSKYFYDAAGDALFQQIMHTPEYYLTRCELEILSAQAVAIADALGATPFNLVELGPGDASKSFYLLKELHRRHPEQAYFPIDISENIITQLQHALPARLQGLQVQGLCGEYIDMLKTTAYFSPRRKVVMFMGASIGNFTPEEAVKFCRRLREQMNPGDLLLIGFDLRKQPQMILDAYNDGQGVTRDFNLNLLTRINRELGADFDINQFHHFPTYDPLTGACKSYLVSNTAQEVLLGEHVIRFRKDEPIFMEISQKYSVDETRQLAAAAGFRPVQHFFDNKRWFTDVLWELSQNHNAL
ncbi:L-histidine N(alpha)-methyltransferase [Chitinophaga alhagiae]|nr:L-histidine N(alpha)-methyltransferase [Chitinophaga alhagiae]